MIKQIGKFTLRVSQPYPCWITIGDGHEEIRCTHHDLRDLEHTVSEAIRLAQMQFLTTSGCIDYVREV